MKVLQAGIFADHELGGCRVFKAGLEECGHEVVAFDYRKESKAASVAGMNRSLLELSRGADLVFIGKGELILPATLGAIRASGVPICLWYGDIRARPEPWLLANLEHVDAFFLSSGGEELRRITEAGRPGIGAYFMNPSHPAFVSTLAPRPARSTPVLFTGSSYGFASAERKAVIRRLSRRRDAEIVGGARELAMNPLAAKVLRRLRGKPRAVRGRDYYDAIRAAKIGIGVNAFQRVEKYTSDRLTHYLELGTFFLCWEFPGIERLFKVGEELDTFSSVDEMAAKIDYYLANDERREEIAAKGQARMLGDYSAKRMVGMMLEVLEKGSSDAFPWVETYSP